MRLKVLKIVRGDVASIKLKILLSMFLISHDHFRSIAYCGSGQLADIQLTNTQLIDNQLTDRQLIDTQVIVMTIEQKDNLSTGPFHPTEQFTDRIIYR